jgi:hypothetical protein
MSADIAFTIAIAAGWIALVVAFVWPTSAHCTCCTQRLEERQSQQRRPR